MVLVQIGFVIVEQNTIQIMHLMLLIQRYFLMKMKNSGWYMDHGPEECIY